MKCRRVGTEGLIGLSLRLEARGYGRRDLIAPAASTALVVAAAAPLAAPIVEPTLAKSAAVAATSSGSTTTKDIAQSPISHGAASTYRPSKFESIGTTP